MHDLTRHRRALICVLGVVLAGSLVGCGSPAATSATDDSSTPAGEPTSEPTSESTSEATSEPTSDGGSSQSPDAPQPTVPGLPGLLLPGQALPGLNDQMGWRVTGTSKTESQRPRWVCQQFSLVTNGAVSAAERTYAATRGSPTAAQVVARTVDQPSAQRLFAVLTANARDCAEQLRAIDRTPRGAVQPLTEQSVPGGRAAWGVVFSGPVRGAPDAAHIDAVAVVQVKDKVSVVSMSSIGQDYNYEPGQSPPEQAIPVVASVLGGS